MGFVVYPEPGFVRVIVLTPPVASRTAVAVAFIVGLDTPVRVYVFAAYESPSAAIVTVEIPTLNTLRFLLLNNP